MQPFLDREVELAWLDDHLRRRRASLLVVYGRRRIGKTALLERLLHGRRNTAYHVATRSTIAEELARLSTSLAAGLGAELLAAQPLASVDALIAFLGTVHDATIVLDEIPFLIESDPSLPGKLQAAWDRTLSRGNLKLIVCGSSIGMMEETFLSPTAPLFGRRTGQLRVGPLPLEELGNVFRWSLARLVELAAVFGAVPGYLERLDPTGTLEDNIRERLLARGEPLYEEVPFLLHQELREPRVYFAILSAIASGATKFGEISSKVGLDRSNLTRYFAVLSDLGLVHRETPITERTPDKSRKGLYRIADPFVMSWFRFVNPHRDLLERGLVREVMPLVKRDLGAYLPRAVEPVLASLASARSLRLPFEPAHRGRYWSPTAEFDLVLLDTERRHAFIGEIKWTQRAVSMALLDDLRRRVANEPAFARYSITVGLIANGTIKRTRKLASDERIWELVS